MLQGPVPAVSHWSRRSGGLLWASLSHGGAAVHPTRSGFPDAVIPGTRISLEGDPEQISHRLRLLRIGRGALLPAAGVGCGCAEWLTVEGRAARLECHLPQSLRSSHLGGASEGPRIAGLAVWPSGGAVDSGSVVAQAVGMAKAWMAGCLAGAGRDAGLHGGGKTGSSLGSPRWIIFAGSS